MTHICFDCKRRQKLLKPMQTTQKEYRQLQIVVSEQGLLKLGGPVVEGVTESLVEDTEAWTLSGEATIFRLPDELISEIFKFAAKNPANEWPRTYGYYGRALILTKVCKRFNRVVQPLIYHTIRFENPCSIAPPCLPAKCIQKTLRANTALGRFCKALKLYVPDVSRERIVDYDIANEILPWFPNVTDFDLQGGWSRGNGPALWEMVQRALKHMPSIRNVSLFREDFYGLLLVPVIEHLTIPSLRKLEIHGMSAVSTDWKNEIKRLHYNDRPKEGYERTASFTTLVISDFGAYPNALAHLLAWPKSLENLTFNRIYSNAAHWDFGTFENILTPYRSSLRTLSIGSLSSGGQTTINLMPFTELTTLTLSRWQLECTPEVASETLLAPKLHTFIWDFGVYDQHSESWSAFGQEQVDWLFKFIDLAAAKRSALRHVEIKFNPDSWSAPCTREGYDAVGYPWDRMDALSERVRPLGCELRYRPKPFYTKDEIEKRIEKHQEDLQGGGTTGDRRELDSYFQNNV